MTDVLIQIDDNLVDEGRLLFDELGISLSSAVAMFISQSVRERGIPFRVSAYKPNDITLASEASLAKIWLSPEEDEAWADL